VNLTEIEKWFDDLAVRRTNVQRRGSIGYVTVEASAWLAEAESAITSAFPLGHPARVPFIALKARGDSLKLIDVGLLEYFDAAAGAFVAAHAMIKANRMYGLVEGIQAETVAQLLDQADALVTQGYLVAGAVIAGGALETHLLHFCNRVGATWTGDGSISKYNNAVGQLRNQGGTGYSANDGKSVEAWGGLRNEAAHTPSVFKRSDQEVRLMIDGIRQFIARNP
jgi:hypothetical protein